MNKANLFMSAAWTGLITLIATIALSYAPLPDAVRTFTAFLSLACCWAMMGTHKADEYTRSLWTSAASFAFASVLILVFAMPFLEGFYDGVRGVNDSQSLSPYAALACSVVAFYVGLFWKLVRGGV